MHVPMTPDALPPDDERGAHTSSDANVVDPVVLAERRAQRAELAEQVASRRAADAQALAAELARERARLEAELDRAQLREQDGTDAGALRRRLAAAEEAAATAEAHRRRIEVERDEARSQVAEAAGRRGAAEEARERAEAERDAVRAELNELSAARDAARAEAVAARDGVESRQAEIDRATVQRDAARAEAAAAREGADAVMTEAAYVQAERDALRAEASQARAERDAIRAELERMRDEAVATAEAAGAARALAEGMGGPPPGWVAGLRAELAVARAAAARPFAVPGVGAAAVARPFAVPGVGAGAVGPGARLAGRSAPSSALQLERRLIALRAAGVAVGSPVGALAARRDDRATPSTELTLERERSSRLQAQLERARELERQLREQIAALERAIAERLDAERRIEAAMSRMRVDLSRTDPHAAKDSRVDALEAQLAAISRRLTTPDPEAGGEAEPAPAPPAASAAPPPAASEGLGGLGRVSRGGGAFQARPAAPTTPAPAPDAAAAPPAQAAPADPPRRTSTSGAVPVVPPALLAERLPLARSATADEDPRGVDTLRLDEALARLRVTAPTEAELAAASAAAAAGQAPTPASRRPASIALPPSGPAAPWLPAALRRLARDDPRTAGRLLAGMLPAQGLVTQRALAYDLVLVDGGTLSVTVGDTGTTVRQQAQPRAKAEVDFRVSTDEAGLARLLLGPRRPLRLRTRVRGSRRRLRELRRLAREPLALRDLASSGATLDPVLAFWLASLAIDPADTFAHRFTVAHAPLPGGPPAAWLRIRQGAPLAVLATRPGEAPAVTLRSTRGALLALLAGIDAPPGQAAAIDGDRAALELLRTWIRRTEYPE
jgi:hypothetical protein